MSDPKRKLRVFLCHASQDKPIVRELYQRFLTEGWIDPWLDEEKLLPGQEWNMEIEKAVEAADAVIVFISYQSVTKEGVVQKEIKRALDKAEEKPEDIIFIIPLRLEDCSVPRRLKVYQWQDYFKNIDVGYKRLCTSLEKRADTVGVDILGIKKEGAQREREEQIRIKAEKRIRRKEEKAMRKEIEERIRKETEEKKEAPLLIEAQEFRRGKSESKLTSQKFELPAELKRKSSKHILGWAIEIVGSAGFILLDVILFRSALQYNEWWIYLLVIVWILISALIAFLIWFIVLLPFFDDSKKILFVDEVENNLVLLAGNRTLGLFNIETNKLLSLYKEISGNKKFVILPDLNLVIFEKGIIFDLKANKVLDNLGDSFGNVIASGKKKNFLVNSDWESITVFDYPSKKIICTFKLFRSSIDIVIVSNNENLIIGYDDAVSLVKIWSIISKNEVDSFNVDSMSSYFSLLVTNKDDSVLAIVNNSKIILYSLVERKKLLMLSAQERIRSAIFVPDSSFLVASVGYKGLIILDTVTGEYLNIKTDDSVDRLLYLESSKEIIGFGDYEHKYIVWNVDNIIETYRKAKVTK